LAQARPSGTGAKRTWTNTVFSLLFTPVGRYAAMGVIIVMALTGVYYKIRADAVAEIEAAATADVLRRTRNAVGASDALDLSPDRVRDPDQHRRD
jgi:high-affinity K+ transport system ATPase subunit B